MSGHVYGVRVGLVLGRVMAYGQGRMFDWCEKYYSSVYPIRSWTCHILE